MSPKEYTVAEAKKHFSELLGRVAYGGERILISKRGNPLAMFVPLLKEPGEEHLSKVEGWLENSDSFFKIVDQITHDRKRHTPRILKSRRE
jgi:prevent-host-death family protein